MKIVMFLLSIIFLASFSYAQDYYDCGTTAIADSNLGQRTIQRGGWYAPAKTMNGASMRVYVIFAQIAGETKDAEDEYWKPDELPVWANSMLATQTSQAPFSGYLLSNYFYEMSYGQNIVLGDVYPELVKVYMNPSSSFLTLNDSVFRKVDRVVNFSPYDRWNLKTAYKQYYNSPDSYMDAVFIIWRNLDPSNRNNDWGGTATIGNAYTSNEGIRFAEYYPTIGMTINAGHRGLYSLDSKLGVIAHEYGHYLFQMVHNFEHRNDIGGLRRRGVGLMPGWAGTIAMNPQEKFQLGYCNYTTLTSSTSGTLPDFQSTGTVLRIPVPLTGDFISNDYPGKWFIIANHQRISPYEKTRGTGVFIYYLLDSNYRKNHLDMVCADGLWQWTVKKWVPTPPGVGGPVDWRNNHPPNVHPDSLPVFIHNIPDVRNGRDEMQEVRQVRYGDSLLYYWDRLFNDDGILEEMAAGHQADVYTMGYNEILNPYSNPATYDDLGRLHQFGFRISGKAGSNYTYEFYADSQSVVNQMPPSRPLDLKVRAVNGFAQLTWFPVIEPDVKIGGKYNIYYAVTNGSAPSNYILSATINAYNGFTAVTSWTDYDRIVGSGTRRVYYRISAVDNSNKESVRSNECWIAWNGINLKETGEEENTVIYQNSLSANYPDPFNPETKIMYSVKNDGHVQLEVYNILGRKVATLVNEFRTAGSYKVSFNGGHLPSGVYIYVMNTKGFSGCKKMLLLK